MTWEQKLSALSAISRLCLRMRGPGDWYVSSDTVREVCKNGMLASSYGNGKTPEQAVEADFAIIAESYETIRISDDRRVRWNGFMWEDIK